MKGSVGHLDIDMAAELLLVVEDIMLDAGGYTISLNAIDVGHHHLRSETGVFAHIFEVAAIERRAIDVHTRTEQDILAAIARLLSYIEAVGEGEVTIPGGGKASERRIGGDGVVVPSRIAPIVPIDFGTHTMGSVAVAHLGDAKTWHTWGRELRLSIAQTNLLGQRHLAECILDALLDGLGAEGIGGYKKGGLGLIGINHHLLSHSSSS